MNIFCYEYKHYILISKKECLNENQVGTHVSLTNYITLSIKYNQNSYLES